MDVVFVSNYYNHHQRFISDALYRLCNSYYFISTQEMREERKKLGYGETDIPNYVLDYNDNTKKKILRIINDADVVIFGSAPEELLRKRIRMHKLSFRYSERPFKAEQNTLRAIVRWAKWKIDPLEKENVFLLCAGAYVSYDYSQYGYFEQKTFKWGYFPKTNQYDINDLLNRKRKNKLLWCGRFLDWKHPDDTILVAKRLKKEGYVFSLDMIGAGVMEKELRGMIKKHGLDDIVSILGSMKPDEVREHMEQAGIYLFTSDRQEGWGAVLNESMNSGCAVVASHEIGSVPFLVSQGENGLIYRSGDLDDLYCKVKLLLDNVEMQESLGRNAYKTIVDEWNAEIAAERLLHLSEHLLAGEKHPDLYQTGPCSRAEIMEDDWL